MVAGSYHQSVPRPPDAVSGAEPPWTARLGQFGGGVSVKVVHEALGPFEDLEYRHVPVTSAVLVPILEVDGDAIVVLTRRSSGLFRDPGNVSFSGGRLDPGEHPREGALREAQEEIGLLAEEVQLVGVLPLVERHRDAELVASYVGFVEGRPNYRLNTDEVEEIIEAPLADLLVDGVAWEETWGQGEQARPVRFFASPSCLGEDLVWGLTARILWDLLDRVSLQLSKPQSSLEEQPSPEAEPKAAP